MTRPPAPTAATMEGTTTKPRGVLLTVHHACAAPPCPPRGFGNLGQGYFGGGSGVRSWTTGGVVAGLCARHAVPEANRCTAPSRTADWAGRRRRAVAGAAIAGLLALACARTPAAETELGGPIFGTTYAVRLAGRSLGDDESAALQGEIDAALERIDVLMSTYRDDSELSRLNRQPVGAPLELSPETLEVLALARRVGGASQGALDVTIGALVDLWGFGPDPGPREVPDDERIRSLRTASGWENLVLDPASGSAARRSAEIRVDLSAVAKGYAVDRVAALLGERGYQDFMVEIGGEVCARGSNRHGTAWQIAIERPEASTRALQRIVPLTDACLATSGDYRNFYEVDGERYSHEIDPRTGSPIRHRLASASVVASSCAEADAWSTALIVLGEGRGVSVALDRGLAALLLVAEDGDFRETATPGFPGGASTANDDAGSRFR